MSPASPSLPVRHNISDSRFEVEIDGRLAVADYVVTDDQMIFTHTYVPPELRGRGVAEALVRPALEEARRTGRRVVAQCSYVARFLERHAEFRDLVA
jgi:hypothetical protein